MSGGMIRLPDYGTDKIGIYTRPAGGSEWSLRQSYEPAEFGKHEHERNARLERQIASDLAGWHTIDPSREYRVDRVSRHYRTYWPK